jgi:3-methyladenine DNA glycosylase AlkD
MSHLNLIKDINNDLLLNTDIEHKKRFKLFFKHKIKSYGVKTPIVRKIAQNYYDKLKDLQKREVLSLCEELFKSNYNEDFLVATFFLNYSLDLFDKDDFIIFHKFINNYVDNWNKSDYFCLYVAGPFLQKYPAFFADLKKWTKSDNFWVRRSAATSLISNKGRELGFEPFVYIVNFNIDKALLIAKKLMNDNNYLVQKGCGWMIKSASVTCPRSVYVFLLKNKDKMTRLVFRSSIENLPEKIKNKF